MKKRKGKKSQAEEPSILELLDRVEAEMNRLRAENQKLVPVVKPLRARNKPPALGKGLSQLFGGPKRG